MKLALVIGTVTSTAKIEAYRGQKLLLVRPIDPRGEERRRAGGQEGASAAPRFVGGAQIAVDRAQAGAGDVILVLDEGNSARQMLGDAAAPVRTVVVGVVDRVDLAGRGRE